jgi:hypothetical protein
MNNDNQHIIDTFKRLRDCRDVHVYDDASRECTYVVCTNVDEHDCATCDVYCHQSTSDDDCYTFVMIDDDTNVVRVAIDDDV